MLHIPFYQHDLGGPELDAIAEVFAGPMLTTGDTVARFEYEFAQYLHSPHALAVTSCTGALHMALLALGVGPGDEVITTPMTFIATAAAIMETGARPVFVDIEADTGNLDVGRIESAITPRTRAIMPVHLYGLMCDMRALHSIAQAHGLSIIEDSAHCVEGTRDGLRPGFNSHIACFSFYATKNLACGEGGALVTKDPDLLARLRLLRLHGMTKTAADRQVEGYKHWDMVMLGWKYNMDNIHAAILLPQLARLARKLQARHALAELYAARLGELDGVRLIATRDKSVHARHLFPIRVRAELRDYVVAQLHARGIGSVVNYRPLHLLSLFKTTHGHKPGAFPNAESFGNDVLSLPFYPDMPIEFVAQVVDTLRDILRSA